MGKVSACPVLRRMGEREVGAPLPPPRNGVPAFLSVPGRSYVAGWWRVLRIWAVCCSLLHVRPPDIRSKGSPPQGKPLRAWPTWTKRRAAPKGGNSAANGHCKRFYEAGRPGPVEVVCTPGEALSLVAPDLSTRRAFKRRALSFRLSVRQPVCSPLIGWRTGASDPSISP